ncbi:hypothetical protein F0U44_11470 [Nocardioides humilatus]|uniref:Uncharacterized protein n=1 Tax=Nocardioides humilatus TaxID=2607660 RepID=A0A5B1LED5_9ACTN|nr:hypothetical protein [Nocardioides humilatus]KAA1419073.1 hypothetical protein F0U44_11470 [Nocardioides humilatus]
MPAAAELMLAELPKEFNDPVAYGDRWIWLALLGLVAVGLYYLAVVWFTREQSVPGIAWVATDSPGAQQEHLDRIDRIEADVRSGHATARDGHQQLSETVRSYVGLVTHLPAPTMTLADFRRQSSRQLTEAIELMYPPEFAPDEVGEAQERFAEAVAHARRLVSSWS